MIQKTAITLCFIVCMAATQAQNKKPAFSKEEFRAKQEAYLREKVELTKEEAARFFPVYFELQDRKKSVNDKAWQRGRKGKEPGTTDAEYEEIIDGIVKARMECDELDWEYLQRFKKILSPKKLFKLQRAEAKFHRDLLKIMYRRPQKNGRK